MEEPLIVTMENPTPEHAPPRRLRSYKRRALVERQAPAASDQCNESLPPQKRIRRTPAYSDLECSSRPRDSPTIPISVHQNYWLEDAIIKTRMIIADKENAETFLQRVAAAESVESLSVPVILVKAGTEARPRLSLNHKYKAEDLRAKYTSPRDDRRRSSDSLHRKDKSEDLRAKYSCSTTNNEEQEGTIPESLPSLEESSSLTSAESLHRKGKSEDLRSRYSSPTSVGEDCISPRSLPPLEAPGLSTSGRNTPDGAPATPSSLESVSGKQQGYLYCVCQRAFDPSLGEMVACDICDGWFHLQCVGQDQHDAMYFEDESFYCPRCEAFAYQEIVSEEEEEEDGGAERWST